MCLEEREGRLHLIHRRREWNSERVMEEKVYDLGLPAAASRVLQHGGDGPDFWAYVDDGHHLHYVSYWLPYKIRVMRVPRASLASFYVLSPHYARVGDAVYCRGVWVPDADADSFHLVPETRFAHDHERVYAFTITEGLDVLEHAVRPLYFLPRCEHFADDREFYRQSNLSKRIERVHADTRIEGYEKKTVMLSCLWHGADAQTEVEEEARTRTLERVRTVRDLFREVLPHAEADWSREPAAHAG